MPEKKAAAKSPKALPAKAAKAEKPDPARVAAKAAAKVAAATAKAAEAPKRGTCTAEKCARPLRAKGYCRKHFMAWRRGVLGGHHHYKICSKEACRKKREFGGLCAEHAGKGAAADSAAAAS